MTGAFTYHIAKYLAGLLRPHTGKTESHIRNLIKLAGVLDTVKLDPSGLLINLDIVPLFMRVPTEPII